VIPVVVAGVDLGASGGRVIAAKIAQDSIELEEVSRFPNEPVLAGGTLHWDILRLYADVVAGLATAAKTFPLRSAGIDSWAVDYGLLDEAGALVGNPVHYRDRRTAGVTVSVSASDLYATTGIQHLPFNTIYQLAAAAGTPALTAARTLLLIPDLLAYWLTGEKGTEVTNASTTALLDVKSRTWATELMDRVGIPRQLFPSLRQPGDVIGPVRGTGAGVGDGVGARLIGADGKALRLVAVASHDTASAVAAVPAQTKNFAYISCGTWSLVGLELDQPVLTEASRQANFTNEAGLDGTVRYLRNVSGLWLLQECQRHWGPQAGPIDDLLRQAAQVPAQRFVIDADDPVFLPPGDMPRRIKKWLASHGRPAPDSPAEFTRCILDSLALAYRKAISDAQELSGRHADVVHIVGGGSRNELLCQLTADATGLPVIAGPAEATALGNVLVQARALGATPPTLHDMRALLRAAGGLRRFDPCADLTPAASAST
jgi:rhamnulokinase